MAQSSNRLIEQAGVAETLGQAVLSEDVWIDVIRKMDEVYANLVHHQLELEAKNAEIEEAHRFIHSVLTSMNDVLIVCNQEGVIQQVNTALIKITGLDEKSLLNSRLGELFTASSRETIEKHFNKRQSCFMSDFEVCLLTTDGKDLPLALNCSPHYDHNGREQGMVILGRPVGELRQAYDDLHNAHKELKQTQQHLVQSEKMASLGRLVAGVAHELNNPISFVFGNMHALKRYGDRIRRYLTALDSNMDKQDLDELRTLLKIDYIIIDIASLIEGTLEGAERVSDIVQDLRRYSSAQSEVISRFDLIPLIEKSVHWVQRAQRISVAITYGMPKQLYIESRKGHLQQILVNLIQNAMDVMEHQEDAQLEIQCQQGHEHVKIIVRDFGPGISLDAQSKLFEPFFTTKPVGKGTGLGLSISYGLAQKIGGELRAENHPHKGAIFSLSLPQCLEQNND